ncbi:MAG TPA: hypothetical protein VL947_12480, partial [Cytophagales bacterium]|nr:hypothetical protein [Cytophagales bacterium]
MRIFKIYFTFFLTLHLFSQHTGKYWVFFKDKDLSQHVALSPKSIENRKLLSLDTSQFTDYPVTPAYVSRLQAHEVG